MFEIAECYMYRTPAAIKYNDVMTLNDARHIDDRWPFYGFYANGFLYIYIKRP